MANPFYIQPASGLGGFQALSAGLAKRSEFEMQKAEQSKDLAKRQEGVEILQSGDINRIQSFMLENPDIAADVDKAYQFKNQVTEDNAIKTAWDIYTDRKPASQALIERADVVLAEGGDASGTLQLAQQAQTDDKSAKAEAALLLMRKDPEAWKLYQETQGVEGEGDITVGAQEILEDGTTIQSLKGGGTKVYDPEGNELQGKKRREAIQVGRAEKVSNLRKAAGGKREAALDAEFDLKGKVEAKVISAKDAAKASSAAFDKVEKIYQNIENLNEAIRLVEVDGADTGAILDRLPSMRSAAVKLDNLQGRLGLDVIGNTTFGALSESELKFALSTALPQRLDGPELVEWSKRKVAAQEKLADYLESSAIYLGTPGNTKAGWLEMQRNKVGNKYGRTQQVTTANVSEMSDDDLLRAAGMQ